jgi:hypothetical protein
MNRPGRSHWKCAVLVVLLSEACAAPTDSPEEPSATGPSASVLCQTGCLDVDPNPSAPGIFIGGDSPATCFGVNDGDNDDLAERCESDLARAFAPQLYYYKFDEMGREPYWVAMKVGGAQRVRIGYLLSYYRDAGSQAFACSIPGAPDSCAGHNGDSEAIFLEVYYNSTTMHWVLYNAKLSAHGAYPVYGTPSFGEYPILTYPGQLGGYPRVWVSQGKHANYANLADCNAGGTLHIDTCNGNNTGARVDASAIYNLGSLTAHTAAQDCVTSRNPSYIYYGSGRKECYWTAVTGFRGWIPTTVGGAEADASYRSILNAQDFGN